jgi:hypothetical protein
MASLTDQGIQGGSPQGVSPYQRDSSSTTATGGHATWNDQSQGSGTAGDSTMHSRKHKGSSSSKSLKKKHHGTSDSTGTQGSGAYPHRSGSSMDSSGTGGTTGGTESNNGGGSGSGGGTGSDSSGSGGGGGQQ